MYYITSMKVVATTNRYRGGFGLFLCSLSLIILTNCAPVTRTSGRAVTLPERYDKSGHFEQPGSWWEQFESAALTHLIASTIDSNFTVQKAQHQLRQAREYAKSQRGAFFPAINAVAGVSASSPAASSDGISLGVRGEYSPTIFQSTYHLYGTAVARASSQKQALKLTRLMVAAQICHDWFSYSEATTQVVLLEKQLETNRKVLQLLQTRFGVGQSRSADIFRQRQLVAASRQQLAEARAEVKVVQQKLFRLTGGIVSPDSLPPTDSLPRLPVLQLSELNAELLYNRPDLLQAQYELEAANHQLAQAVRNRFPTISLQASLKSNDDFNATGLFSSWVQTIAADLLAPLFAGGSLSAQAQSKRAASHAALAHYKQTLLSAVEQIETAIIREQQLRSALASLTFQHTMASKAYRQLQQSYLSGVGEYIDVLQSLRDSQRLEQTVLKTRRDMLHNRVVLYSALYQSPHHQKLAASQK